MHPSFFQHWRRWHLFVMALLFIGLGCNSSGSSGCSCAKPILGGFPQSAVVKNVAQIKLTKRGTDFIQTNNDALIKMFLPKGLEFDVPQSSSSNVDVCRNPPCKIIGTIRKLDLQMVPANKLRAGLWLDIKTQRDMEIRVKQKIPIIGEITKTCKISLRVSNKQITTDITFGVHPANNHLTVDIGDPSFSISNSDFKIDGDIICDLVDLLKGLFKGLIEKEAKKALGDAIGEFTCKKCKQASDCGFGATCSSGICMQGGKCLPLPLGTEGAVDVSTLLSGFGNKQSKDLMFSAFVGGRAEVKTDGVELGMVGGTSSEDNPCVEKKTFAPLVAPIALNFPATTTGGKPYMVGIGISDVMLKAAARDLYRSGALCLRIDSSLSASLGSVFSAQGIGVLFPSLTTLVGSSNPPLYIALRPSEPPVIDIGSGTLETDSKGNTVIKDPLLDFKIPKLNFDFMMKLHDRWVRLFSFQSDVVLPLALTVKPGNKLGLVMGELGTALQNPKVFHSYMLSETPESIAATLGSTLKAILPLAAGSLGNQEFAVPDLQGFVLSIQGIHGLIPRTDKPNRFQFLGLFADLGLAPPAKPLMPEAPIGLRLEQRNVPAGFADRLKNHQPISTYPSVVITVDDPRSDREYGFRLNGGMWGPYHAGIRHTLESAQFMFQGKHEIEVRSRSAVRAEEDDYGTGRLSISMDYTAPSLSLKQTGSGFVPVASDNLTPKDELQFEYRVGGEWLPMPAQGVIPTQGLPHGTVLQVRATDHTGNQRISSTTIYNPTALTPVAQVAPVSQAPRQVEHAPAPTSSRPIAACSQLAGSTPPDGLLLLLLGLLIFCWRRQTV